MWKRRDMGYGSPQANQATRLPVGPDRFLLIASLSSFAATFVAFVALFLLVWLTDDSCNGVITVVAILAIGLVPVTFVLLGVMIFEFKRRRAKVADNPPSPLPQIANAAPGTDLSAVPLEPLKDDKSWTRGGLVPGYTVVRTLDGIEFRASKADLYWGLIIAAAAVTAAVLAPQAVWDDLMDNTLMPGEVKIGAIMLSLCLASGGPIIVYLYRTSKRPHVLFDRRHGRVVDVNGVIGEFPLSELLAVQVCRDLHLDRKNQDGSDSYELLLVRKRQDGQMVRHLLMRIMEAGRTRKMARRISEAMGVPLMDCTRYD